MRIEPAKLVSLVLLFVPTAAAGESGTAEQAVPATAAQASGWSDFVLGGTHGFAGVVLGPALTNE